jgi:hypothetical protein
VNALALVALLLTQGLPPARKVNRPSAAQVARANASSRGASRAPKTLEAEIESEVDEEWVPPKGAAATAADEIFDGPTPAQKRKLLKAKKAAEAAKRAQKAVPEEEAPEVSAPVASKRAKKAVPEEEAPEATAPADSKHGKKPNPEDAPVLRDSRSRLPPLEVESEDDLGEDEAPTDAPVKERSPGERTTSKPAPSAPPTKKPAPPPGDDEEVVETIDLGPTPTVAAPAAPAPSADPLTVKVSGWARGTGFYFSQRAPRDRLPPLEVPHDRLRTDEQLYLRVRAARSSFEAVVSGLLAHVWRETDARGDRAYNLFTGESVQVDYEAQLQEAYLGFFWEHVDLRLGQQRLAWGRGDAFAPNDVLNPVDLRDPVLVESDVARRPTLLARADFSFGELNLQLVASPFFLPNRVDAYGSNWALIQADAPALQRGLLGMQTSAVHPSLHAALQPLLTQSELPRPDLKTSSAGARLSWSGAGFDLAGSYHYGYALTPRVTLDRGLAAMIAPLDFTSPADQQQIGAIAANGLFRTTYERRHHLGLDGEVTQGSFALRGDLAYDSRVVVPRRDDLTGVALPSLSAVLAVELDTGEVGKVFRVEALYQRLLDAPDDGELLGFRRQNVSLAGLARYTFFEGQRLQLEVEARGVYGVAPRSYLVRPQLALKIDALSVRVGVLLLGGVEGSQAHYYRRNDGGYLTVRYAF